MAVAATDPDGEITSRGLVSGVDRLRDVGRATHALAAGRVEGGARRAWTAGLRVDRLRAAHVGRATHALAAGRVEGGARRAWTAGLRVDRLRAAHVGRATRALAAGRVEDDCGTAGP